MKIVCIIQLFNEVESGNLSEFIRHHLDLFDHVIAYDDGSTDDTYSVSLKNFSCVIRSGKNDFQNETSHKERLIVECKKYCPDFIVSLDADEKLLVTKDYLYGFLRALPNEVDGVEIPIINLWRSNYYARKDKLFGDLTQIKIWRFKDQPPFQKHANKLHQEQFPDYVKNLTSNHDIKILHSGFNSAERILEKFCRYRDLGQSGFDLMRLIDESELKLEKLEDVSDVVFPLTIEDYFNLMGDKNYNAPKVTIFSLIYQDIGWLEFVYKKVLETTAHLNVEFYFVANKPTAEVRDYLIKQYIPHYIFEDADFYEGEHYINGVYRAWNFGVAISKGDIVVMINSDMAFAEGWLDELLLSMNGNNCVASRLVERGKIPTGKYGIEKNFGDSPNNYSQESFESYAKGLRSKEVKNGGLYMPLMIRKKDFIKVGGYPSGNIAPGSDIFSPKISLPSENCISGDEVLMRKLSTIGVVHQTCFSSVAYHFQEGEMRTKTEHDFNAFSVCVCNDTISGKMGEKVLWNYLCELPSVYGIDFTIVNGKSSWFFKRWWDENGKKPNIIIQNASFIDKISDDIFTIAFLQDDLRRMQSSNLLQERVLATSDYLVTNSYLTASSYPDLKFKVIPVGVDDRLFLELDKFQLRLKYNLDIDKKVGIFVGALNDVKGWPEIKTIVNNRTDIHWIIVTKDSNRFFADHVSYYSKISQVMLCELLNCADFFILGSKVETQCLAAIESCLCNTPVVMKRTGIFAQVSNDDLSKLGEFCDDLQIGVEILLAKLDSYNPRATIKKYKVTTSDCMAGWVEAIKEARYLMDRRQFSNKAKNIEKLNFLFFLELFYRKKFLRSLIGRDSFYSLPEISIFLKGVLHPSVHIFIRLVWRFIKRIK